jgi:putative nucleotidyltransferase with HDIG domain
VNSDSKPPSEARLAAAQTLLNECETITAAPPVAFQIFNLTRQPDSSSDALINLVQLDPELTAQMLRLVNSPQFRGSGASSIDEAVMRLGTNEIANIAMAVTMGRLSAARRTAYLPDPDAFWKHCLGCALVCRRLRRLCTSLHMDPQIAFTAGLLHDIGKIVINSAPAEALEVIADVMREEEMTNADAELAVFGADHAEIGGLMLEKWNLPPELVNAVRFHHAPEFDRAGLAMLVHVANCCSKVHATSRGWDDFVDSLHPRALEHLGVSIWTVQDCWSEVLQSIDEIETFVSR